MITFPVTATGFISSDGGRALLCFVVQCSWFVGMLVCWSVGPLVRWSVGMFRRRFIVTAASIFVKVNCRDSDGAGGGWGIVQVM